ncbi:low-density lipoprotein receptor-related protein 3-like, partial [Stegodyphus dumicola]|uniref:low-density lipoprotein receptor-related protein 3-like n=1 Tax=Stegodyphus dumicola TaxID=202533 RepID=UPI0015AFB633
MDLLFFTIVILPWCAANAEFQPGSKLLAYIKSNPVCPEVELTEREGIISSPFYPDIYPKHISCGWHIRGNIGDVITVMFDDVDIEESCCCNVRPCCMFNWIKIGPLIDGSEGQFCGKGVQYHNAIISSTHKLWIKFHISKFTRGGRGFRFHYKISTIPCPLLMPEAVVTLLCSHLIGRLPLPPVKRQTPYLLRDSNLEPS